ncbi:MAG: thioesterase family protein [Thermodesulfobacteriota bacterium]
MNAVTHSILHRVIYGDTDAAAVVYNANYLRYFEMGRTEFMRELVCPYQEIEKLGIIMPVVECHIRFKAPAFYDDLVIIETRITELKKLTCKFSYRILREEADKKTKLLAKGFTLHAPVNRNGKLTPLPEEITARLRSLAPPSN